MFFFVVQQGDCFMYFLGSFIGFYFFFIEGFYCLFGGGVIERCMGFGIWNQNGLRFFEIIYCL